MENAIHLIVKNQASWLNSGMFVPNESDLNSKFKSTNIVCSKHSAYLTILRCETCDVDGICLRCFILDHLQHVVGKVKTNVVEPDIIVENKKVEENGTKVPSLDIIEGNHSVNNANSVDCNIDSTLHQTAPLEIDSPKMKDHVSNSINEVNSSNIHSAKMRSTSSFVVFAYSDIEKPVLSQMKLGIGRVTLSPKHADQFRLLFMMTPRNSKDILDCIYDKIEQEMDEEDLIHKNAIVAMQDIKFDKVVTRAAVTSEVDKDTETYHYTLTELAKKTIRDTAMFPLLYPDIPTTMDAVEAAVETK